jgi:hypothetical protein
MTPRDPPLGFPTPHGHEPGPYARARPRCCPGGLAGNLTAQGVLAVNLQLRRCVNPRRRPEPAATRPQPPTPSTRQSNLQRPGGLRSSFCLRGSEWRSSNCCRAKNFRGQGGSSPTSTPTITAVRCKSFALVEGAHSLSQVPGSFCPRCVGCAGFVGSFRTRFFNCRIDFDFQP